MTNTKKNEESYFVANDTGYGYLKASINEEELYIPTTLSKLSDETQFLSPNSLPDYESMSEKEKDDYFKNISDHEYVSFEDTSLVSLNSGRYLLGKRAYTSTQMTEELNFNAKGGKAGQTDTYAYILTAIAYNKVKNEYFAKKEDFDLDKPLEAKVDLMVGALPVSQSRSVEEIDNYKNKFIKGKHTVTLWNFRNNRITVNVKFERVEVTREGLIARLALLNADTHYPEMVKHSDQQLAKDYGKGAYSAQALFKAKNCVLIDIGSGTTDIVLFINGRPTNISASIPVGYNSVLDKVLDILRNKNNGSAGFENSHELDDYIRYEQSDMKYQKRRAKLLQLISEQAVSLKTMIFNRFQKMVSGKFSVDIDAIFVFGGGANALNEYTNMKELFENEANQMGFNFDGEPEGIPVVWIGTQNPEEASTLNLKGLELQLELLRKAS